MSVSNPLQLKTAVEALKKHDAEVASGSQLASRATSAPRASITSNAVAGSCAPGSIIDNSPGSACTPAYPDPTNSSWQAMVGAVLPFGAFNPPGSVTAPFSSADFADVSPQGCSLTVESNLVQVVAALNGTVTVAAIACGAANIDPIGGSVAAGVCDAAVAVVGVAGAVSQGLLADCFEQDADVNAAGIDASLRNTVTIFNDLNGINNTITTEFNAAATQLTNVNTQITGEFGALDTHLTNVDNHVAAEFATLSAQIVTLVNQLGNQIAASTALMNADMRQVMKLEMTPDGQKKLNPAILTCTGTNCPNVLANCPAAGCSWNNVGPLP